MIRRFLTILAFALATQVSFAQSMSDDQVINYVMQQQERGRSQQQIVSDLLKKGVTVDQLRRIRKKYEAEQSQLGAQDLTGAKQTTVSRQRQNKQLDGERSQMQNNYMIRNQFRTQNPNYGTRDERLQALNGEIGFFDIDSLNYYRNLYNDESEVFGRNIFNNEMLSFQPSMSIATPANYRLGPGDKVIIDVWGASQQTIEGDISPDGTITIPDLGPIKLSGMSVSEANAYLKNKLGAIYQGSSVQMTLGDTRSIQVQVIGEVNVPGTYTISSLSTAFNALYLAGGISDIGTLRNIAVYRQGKRIAQIDVYDYLLHGNSKGDVRLQDNDVVTVGTYDALVEIRGKVKRPMFYEMKKGESAKTLLEFAGGFRGDAFKKHVRLTRKNGAEYSMHTIDEFDMNGFKLDDGDSVFVDSVVARYSNMVEVKGAVFHPGMYEMNGKISTVRELIAATQGLREDAFVNRAVMHRQKEDMTLEVLSVDVLGVMNGTVADIPLRKNDVIFIPSKLDMLGEQTLTISGEVNYPGIYTYASNTALEDLVIQAGGLTEAASTVKVDVFRRVNDPSALSDNERLTETFSFALKDGFVVDGQPGFTLLPYDEVVVRKNPTYNKQQNVTIEGAVNFTGQYSLTNKDYRLSDLVNAAGGVNSVAYMKGARLERLLTEDEKKQVEATLRQSQINLYEESMQTDNKNFDLVRADSLLSLKLEMGNVYPVAINLEEAMKNPKGADDLVLRDGDKLIIPQFSNTVKISGDVMYPITMNYEKGKSLNYYIKRAGGYGDNARKSRVYAIYMNGSVELLSHYSRKAVQPGCQIVVPSKKQKNRMSTAEIMSIGSSSASIAAVMATIGNLFKK